MEIKQLLEDCALDLIIDVRNAFYFQNWRIKGGEHHPYNGREMMNLDPDRIARDGIKKVGVYCWTRPWQSEPAARWLSAMFPDITVYDLKGLSYLDDIPGFCKYIDGAPFMLREMAPQCRPDEVGTHVCPAGTAQALEAAVTAIAGRPQPSDINEDGSVTITDLLIMLSAFGQSAAGDVDGDGLTSVNDILQLLRDFTE